METNIVNGPWDPNDDSTIKFSAASGNPEWAQDLKLRRCEHIKKLIEQLTNRCQIVDPEASYVDQVDQGLRSLPGEVRVRIAVRAGLAELRRAKTKLPKPVEILNEEIEFLTNSLESKRVEIERLETRILAVRPKNTLEAKLLLDFASKLVSVGRKIEDRCLADILGNCALALSTPANTGPKASASG